MYLQLSNVAKQSDIVPEAVKLLASDLKAILESILSHFTPSALFKDVTIEIAPETVDLEKLCALRKAGFSRVSFGFQSLDERRVKLIGRAHTANQAVAAFSMARQAGFDNIKTTA